MRLPAHFDQLRVDPHLARIPSHTSFQHILHSQLPPNLIHLFRGVPVMHHRRPRNDPKFLRVQPSQLRDHLFRQSVAEILLAFLSGHILEGQYRQHHPPSSVRDLRRTPSA